MLETFTLETFLPRVGETFSVSVEGLPPLEFVLVSATAWGDDNMRGSSKYRQPFSLLFSGPLQPVLPQRIYPLENAETGAFELFLVPLGPQGEGMRYEAIFT